jgi:DNA-binding CsgD family transcriptional regulator
MVDAIATAACQRLRAFPLTPRETEIACLVLKGFSNKEIGALCFISELTVKDHVKHVFKKVGIRSRAGLLYQLLTLSSNGQSSTKMHAGQAMLSKGSRRQAG